MTPDRCLSEFTARGRSASIRLAASTVLALVCTTAACAGQSGSAFPLDQAGAEPRSSAEGGDRADRAQGPAVVLRNGEGVDWTVRVEVARNRTERMQGLMNRKSLASDCGMIFIYPDDAVRDFWMRNTLIPLDMLFITGDHVIAGIVENAEPLTDTLRNIDRPSRFVLEINGGAARAHGIFAGDSVRFIEFAE